MPLEVQQLQQISILVKQMGTNFLVHSILTDIERKTYFCWKRTHKIK